MPRLKRPSPSMAVALLALVIALGGTATAATVLINSSDQIKNGVIKRADLAPSVINSNRVQDGSLTASDLNAKALGGAAGGTQAFEAYRAAGPEVGTPGESATVVTLRDLPAGSYAIFAKSVLSPPSNDAGILSTGEAIGGHCVLDAGGDTDDARTLLGSPGALAPGALSMQTTRSFASPGTVTLRCDVVNASWRASDSSIIAVKLGSAPKTTIEP